MEKHGDEGAPTIGGSSMTDEERQNHAIDVHSYPSAPVNGTTSLTAGARQSTLTTSKEMRAMEALAMKDEQVRMISDQNSQLLKSMNSLDDEKKELEMAKVALEEENRILRDKNFEMQSKVRAADEQLRKATIELEDREKQHKIMTDQNGEVLRLLEHMEYEKATLDRDQAQLKEELDALKGKYASLLSTAKTHEKMATQAAIDGQNRAEEVRLLRTEKEQLLNANKQLKLNTQVEIESLQEQLRITKEKQYQLLQKQQADEEAKQQIEDQVLGMEEKLRTFHAKTVELQTQVQVETRAKKTQQESNKALTIEVDNYARSNKQLQERIEQSETERLRIEAESRDTSEQLMKMSEKVFQLLERMKLAELGKTKAIEALKRKEQEMVSLKKKNNRLIKESTHEGKGRVKAELDKKVLLDQIRALKQHNAQLNNRCRDEVKGKLKEMEERKVLAEKVQTLGGRLSFLLNKMQADEEAKIVTKEEMKKMQAQLHSLQDRNHELQQKISATGESNRVITQAMRLKQEELDEVRVKYENLQAQYNESLEENTPGTTSNQERQEGDQENEVAGEDLMMGKGFYYIESKPAHGLLLLKARPATQRAHPKAAEFLEKYNVSRFLRNAQKEANVKQLLITKIGHLLGHLINESNSTENCVRRIENMEGQITHLTKKVAYIQQQLGSEEEAKRRTLLRYVHAVKATPASTAGEPMDNDDHARLQLPESGIGDEEVHAIAALLRGNLTIRRLNFKKNTITDEGARAIAAILAATTNLASIDLRNNNIGQSGIKVLAESLERNQRIRHVYVHAGGKIEALGATGSQLGDDASDDPSAMVGVETICVVDVRENTPKLNEFEEEDEGPPSSGLASPVAAKVVPLNLSKMSIKTKPKASTLSNKDALERRREKQQREREKQLRQKEKDKNKVSEKNWSGFSGGMTTNLPQLTPSPSAKSMKKSASAVAVRVTSSTSLKEVEAKGSKEGYHRRLVDSPLASSSKTKD